MQFGKYKSRRKKTAKKPKRAKPKATEGAGLLGDIGYGLNEVGKFVEQSGKTVTDITAKVAAAGGQAISYIGDTIKDKKIKKGFKDVGRTMSGTAKDVVNFLGKASPYIGKAGQFVGDKMMKSDTDYQTESGGSLFDSMAYTDNNHAHEVMSNLSKGDFHAIRSAARYISGQPAEGDLMMLHHKPYTTVGIKHFQNIAGSSTPEHLLEKLKNDSSGLLHHAIQTSAHSAHLAGSHEFHTDGHTHLGGGFWDDVGKGLGKGLSVTGRIAGALAPATALIPIVGPEGAIILGAAGAAMAVGGDAITKEYK